MLRRLRSRSEVLLLMLLMLFRGRESMASRIYPDILIVTTLTSHLLVCLFLRQSFYHLSPTCAALKPEAGETEVNHFPARAYVSHTMPAPYTGHKRSYEPRDRDDDYGRRDRPRDWRDAYLSDRDSGGSRSRRQDSYSPRSRDHGSHGDRHRGNDRERGRSGRGYNESRYDDREEGE